MSAIIYINYTKLYDHNLILNAVTKEDKETRFVIVAKEEDKVGY